MTFMPTFATTKAPSRSAALRELFEMLQVRRPSSSKSERGFVYQFLRPLRLQVDPYGNLYKQIGDAPVLWSCHTDTVHHKGGVQALAARGALIKLARKETISNCLGADCTAGVWIMTQMIRAGKPGLYVFHRDEEIGGWGSNYIANKRPKFLEGIDMAIAFDRYGTTSVITHQGWQRCCSEMFASSLSKELGMSYKADSTGIFTDTANYVDLVSECTNLSVGYEFEHTKREYLDTGHLFDLLEAILELDVCKLDVLRTPGTTEWDEGSRYYKWVNSNYLGTATGVNLWES